MVKRLVLSIFALSIGLSVFAQDAQFSQFYANPLYLNPALAGSQKCPRVKLTYRNQYPSLGAYETVAASYDQFFNGLSGGLGFLVLNDVSGDGAWSRREVSMMYSYHLVMTRDLALLVGFQAGFTQMGLDQTRLLFGDQIHPLYGFVNPTAEVLKESVSYVDFSTGFVLFSDNYYFGGAFHHLTEPENAFIATGALPMKMTFHGGASIPITSSRLARGKQAVLNPGILYQGQGETHEQLNYMLSLTTKDMITAGLSFRHNFNNADAVILMLGFSPDKLTVGYSYDYTVSSQNNGGGGAHELTVGYQFPCAPKKKKFKTINCPKF